MITAIDGQKMITTFYHVLPNKATQTLGGTYCYIKEFDESLKDEDRSVVAVGYAQVYFKDKDFNKQVGRKWALQYALGLNRIALRKQQAKGRKESSTIYGDQFTKEQRDIFWSEYWRSHRVGPLSKVRRLEAKITELEAIISKTSESSSDPREASC